MTPSVVLITRALTGIGRATALAFAQEGAQLVVSGRREQEGEKLVAELRKLGAEAEFVRSDVRHEAEIRSLVDRTVARFGRLDGAVPDFDIDLLGHGYFAHAESLLHDLHDLMRHNEAPAQRQRITAAVYEGTAFWRLKR